MKKLLILFTVFSLFLFSCSGEKKKSNDIETEIVKVGIVGESDYQIWEPLIYELSKQGIIIELVSFGDYTIPNQALNDGEIDLNAFQHHAFLDDEVKNKGYNIEAIADTYISAMNIYSKKIASVKDIKDKDKVAIPNDPSNGGRALKVLEAAGLIKVSESAGDTPSVKDITDNPYNLNIVEVDAGAIYTLLDDVACAVINGNYAIDFGLNPGLDYIFRDDPSIYSSKSFVNLIAARSDNKDKEVFKKIIRAYQSPIVENVYNDAFKGSYIPTWN